MSEIVPFQLIPERQYEESKIQRSVANFLRWSLPENATYFAIPNSGFRSRQVTGRLIGEGLRAGVPDLLCISDGHPIFIELKTHSGSLSPVQKQMHQKLVDAGADVFVARSVEAVQTVLLEAGVRLRGKVG